VKNKKHYHKRLRKKKHVLNWYKNLNQLRKKLDIKHTRKVK